MLELHKNLPKARAAPDKTARTVESRQLTAIKSMRNAER